VLETILVALALVLHLVIAIVLVRKYLRTRDVGFVWLGVAVVIWPLVSFLLQHSEGVLVNRIVRGQRVGFYPFSLLERGQMSIGSFIYSLNLLQQLIGVCLLLVAVLYLSKTKSNGNREAAG
jgi:hypothetical protein